MDQGGRIPRHTDTSSTSGNCCPAGADRDRRRGPRRARRRSALHRRERRTRTKRRGAPFEFPLLTEQSQTHRARAQATVGESHLHANETNWQAGRRMGLLIPRRGDRDRVQSLRHGHEGDSRVDRRDRPELPEALARTRWSTARGSGSVPASSIPTSTWSSPSWAPCRSTVQSGRSRRSPAAPQMIDFVIPAKGDSLLEGLEMWHRSA